MSTPLNASASTAGALFSNSMFEIPQFQREYSWQEEEVEEFWTDLQKNIDTDTYFLGLIILTEEGEKRKHVVDGQQRLVTITLLATALFYEARQRERSALADRIQADFLRSIDYDTDDTNPRVRLSDTTDDQTLQSILDTGEIGHDTDGRPQISRRINETYVYLRKKLAEDLRQDPFKRLGKWTEFLTNKVYFAVFIHPDPASAYQVFEVINTRGKELTTADLLKSYVLSQTPSVNREIRYQEWQRIAQSFPTDGLSTFVQYIRHVVTVQCGHVLPKDLYGFIAQRARQSGKIPPTPEKLMLLLEEYLPLYLQMIDQTLAGPADEESLNIFGALNSLGIITVRPLMIAIHGVPNSLDGMKEVLRIVVRRIVVGNLGTGNVERRFSEAAKRVHESGEWRPLLVELRDLNPSMDDFESQLRRRSYNKATLTFLRRSILGRSITPRIEGTLHFILPRNSTSWTGFSQEEGAFWGGTIGNTFLANLKGRPSETSDWDGFKTHLLPYACPEEWRDRLMSIEKWNAATVEEIGDELSRVAGDIWYS